MFGRATIRLGISPHSSCVRFSSFSTMPRDCVGRTSLKWHCFVLSGMSDLNSVNHSISSLAWKSRHGCLVLSLRLSVSLWRKDDSFHCNMSRCHSATQKCIASYLASSLGMLQSPPLHFRLENCRSTNVCLSILHRHQKIVALSKTLWVCLLMFVGWFVCFVAGLLVLKIVLDDFLWDAARNIGSW